MRFYRQYFNRALSSKSEENAFRRYLLGQFCGAETEYVPLEKIKTCDESIFREKGIRWVVGCDYSVVFDFTAISLIGWKRSEDKIFVKPFLFLPNTRKRRESQKLILEQWDRDNYITIQNCDVLDGEAVCDTVQNYLVDNKISPEIVTFDRALSAHHIEGFSNHKTEAIRGTARELTGGIREVERVAHSGGLYFVGGQNPCLKWMFGNCIVSQKSKNFVLLNRLSTAQNIDGPVSIVMGMRWLLNNEKNGLLLWPYKKRRCIMPIKFAKGAFRVTSRTYLKRIPQGGFAPDKISYDFSVTIPQGQLQKLGKATKRGLKNMGVSH